MAVPAGFIVHVEAQQEAAADNEVLQDLVQGVPDVDRAIGVGGPVVQHEQRRSGRLSRLTDPMEQVVAPPAIQDLRLKLGQAGAHGEWRLRQEDGGAIVPRVGGMGGGCGVVGHDSFQRSSDKGCGRSRRALELSPWRHAGRLIRESVRTAVMRRMYQTGQPAQSVSRAAAPGA